MVRKSAPDSSRWVAKQCRRVCGCSGPPQAEFAAALEQLVDGKVAPEDEVAAILDLADGVEARQVELGPLLLRELRPEDEGPVVEPPSDDVRAQPVGRRLQRRHVVNGEEGVVALTEADPRPLQLLLDEAVAVKIRSEEH